MQSTLIDKPLYKTQNLFSIHYLENYLKQHTICKEIEFKNSVKSSFDNLQKVYQKLKKSHPEKLNEAQLREDFISKILSDLGFVYDVETPILDAFGVYGRPDYSVFSTDDEKIHARNVSEKDTISFFNNAIGLVEAKEWKIDLDKAKAGKGGNPSLQISNYLLNTKVRWGILTNGRLWRLYYRETCSRLDSYLEINLADILDQNNLIGYKWFYLLFRKDSFVPKEGVRFLDEIYNENVKRSKELEKNVKENVYDALRLLAKGFLDYPDNNLTSSNLKEIHDNCLILLYRLLFILYAEASERNLLPVKNPVYYDFSLGKITEEISRKDYDSYFPTKDDYWSHLKFLFTVINFGSENRKIPREKLEIPPYNGGLFDTTKHTFLEKYKIGDRYLAEAIDLLARSPDKGSGKSFVDYSTLEIRQLGSIYEGLLEYQIQIAEIPMVAILERKSEKWIPQNEYNGKKSLEQIDEKRRVNPGDLFLITDKGERKATGSYYTPDYIVEYIVKNTIEPVVEEKWKEAEIKNESFVSATLSVKVLDPAMGSGHFLVGALDFLANKLLLAVEKDSEHHKVASEYLPTKDWARREILAHCIYGVDLNPLAVELAKVSLWLTTISKDKPLSFLDHRLKQGNSLIGANLSDLPWYHEGERDSILEKEQRPVIPPVIVEKVLSKITEIESTKDDTLTDIKKKEAIFQEFKKIPEYQKLMQIANLNTSFYFGNKIEKTGYKVPSSYYYDLLGSLYGNENQWQSRINHDWFRNGASIASKKNFFHWELEFPEIFFENGQLKKNSGWDVIIGNPPYIRIQTIIEWGDMEADYLERKYRSTRQGNYDIYIAFVEKGLSLLNKDGQLGLILPHKFFNAKYGEPLRSIITDGNHLKTIVHFGHLLVFEKVSTYTCLLFLSKQENQIFSFEKVEDLTQWRFGSTINQTNIQANLASSDEWNFVVQGDFSLFDKLNKMPNKLEHVTDRIFQGIKTSADKIFIVFEIERNVNQITIFSPEKNKNYLVESSLFHPLVKSGDNKRYFLAKSNRMILFPYEYKENTAHLIPESCFKELYPLTWAYLLENRDYLENRENGKMKGEYWYGYGRIQALDVIDHPKIFTPDFVPHVSFSLDPTGELFFTGGAAGGYGILVSKNTSRQVILGILNSKLINWYLPKISTPFRGGWFSCESRFIKKIPIPILNVSDPTNFALYNDLISLVNQMLEMEKTKNDEILGFIRWLEREISSPITDLKNKTIIEEYYTKSPDDIISILKLNKRKISIDPSRRTFSESIEREISSSKDRIIPLISKINSTDDLIDQIVYKLYRLSDEEIEIVERNTNKN